MQEEVDLRPEEDEADEENPEVLTEFEEEEGYESFEEQQEMEPDEDLEPVGEQSPNTREAFEEGEEEDDFLFEEE